MTKTKFASYIDHTLLAPNATEKQIIQLCQEAERYGFASVCVNPYYVKLAAETLSDSKAKVCTVIGFPLGMNLTRTKVEETGGANIILVTKDNKIITPKSNTILPSITRRSAVLCCSVSQSPSSRHTAAPTVRTTSSPALMTPMATCSAR